MELLVFACVKTTCETFANLDVGLFSRVQGRVRRLSLKPLTYFVALPRMDRGGVVLSHCLRMAFLHSSRLLDTRPTAALEITVWSSVCTCGINVSTRVLRHKHTASDEVKSEHVPRPAGVSRVVLRWSDGGLLDAAWWRRSPGAASREVSVGRCRRVLLWLSCLCLCGSLCGGRVACLSGLAVLRTHPLPPISAGAGAGTSTRPFSLRLDARRGQLGG